MLIDRRNRFIYIAETEMDRQSLIEWAKVEPFVHVGASTDFPGYSICRISRTEDEKQRLWPHALLHTEPGRRLANRCHLVSYAHAAQVLGTSKEIRNQLFDFQPPPDADLTVSPQKFSSLVKNFGYTRLPQFLDTATLKAVKLHEKEETDSPVSDAQIPVFYINVDRHTERRELLESDLKALGWTASRISATTPDNIEETALLPDDWSTSRSTQIEHALSISHLRALEAFLETNTAWGLILEDDIELLDVRRWNFGLTEITQAVPPDTGLLQLCQIWPIAKVENTNVQLDAPSNTQIRPYLPGKNWGSNANLVSRDYALHVLAYYKNQDGKFDLTGYPGHITADVWIYDNTRYSPTHKIYSVVLLTCRDVPSTLEHTSSSAPMQKFSRLYALQLMKEKIDLSDVFTAVQHKDYPFVSILTPSYNRRHLLPILEQCILNQTYPRCRMEWIIVDDSQDGQPPFKPLEGTGLTVRNVVLEDKMTLGAKRNYTGSLARGEICVFMDDDDYYVPTRVSHAVEKLETHPQVHVAGSTYLALYFLRLKEFYLAGPWGDNHAMGGALVHRRILLETQRFDPTASHAEEPSFLNRYTIPLIQLDPWQTLVCLAHDTNTYDKKRLLGGPKLVLSPKPLSAIMHANVLSRYLALHEAHNKSASM